MGLTIYYLIDLLWLPVTWFAVHPHQRVPALVTVAAILVTFRTEAELIGQMGPGVHFLHILSWPPYACGLVACSFAIMLYLMYAHFFPKTHKMVFFAASLGVYVMAFAFSMLLMII